MISSKMLMMAYDAPTLIHEAKAASAGHRMQTKCRSLFSQAMPEAPVTRRLAASRLSENSEPTAATMQTYDFIIVGSGSAGSVVAERLSASGRFSVLVLEAGGTDRRFYVQMPLGYGKTFFDPAVNWNYKTEPDPGLAGNADHWPRGKLLGGSSSINAMVWIRGAREDFDAWAAAGNPGWGFDDLLPAFKAIEDNQVGADEWRGVGGPLHITDCSMSVHPLTKR